jgi:hypothetical protein
LYDFLHRLIGEIGIETIPAWVFGGAEPFFDVSLERIYRHPG